MKAGALILFLAFCAVECRKTYAPINKNANIDFINMESGGGVKPPVQPPVQPQQRPPAAPAPASPTTKAPTPAPVAKPTPPAPTPITVKPPQPNPPANQKPVGNPTTTPLPGSVQHLINYYDSQGKGTPIRPYSYSQAVKQG